MVIPYAFSEAVLQMCSLEKLFWKKAANLLENTHAEVFGMGVLL